MTEKKYWQTVKILEEQDPEHILLATLQRGYSKINIVYLRAAVKDMPPPDHDTTDHTDDIDPEDPTYKMLKIQERNLFTERAKLSNAFHTMTTNEARAANSEAIGRVQKHLQALWKKIEHYQEFGTLPSSAENETYPLPKDRGLLAKKINSIRAMISQAKKKLDALFDDKAPKSEIDKAEKRLQYLQNYLKYAETTFQAATV